MIPGQYFLHIGLHKTGTTWFQKEVYPYFEGAKYLHKPLIHKLISLHSGGRYILCEEALLRHLYGRSHKQNLPIIAKLFPDAQIILFIRRQDSWLRSAYNHYIKRGGCLPFDRFFDLETDSGLIKRNDLFFSSIIQEIDLAFSDRKAWVFSFDSIKTKPFHTVSMLAHMMDCTVDLSSLKFARKNVSISDKAGQILLSVNPYIKSEYNPDGFLSIRKSWLRKIGVTPERIAGIPVIKFFGRPSPLIEEQKLDRIREYYSSDWEICLARIDSAWDSSAHLAKAS